MQYDKRNSVTLVQFPTLQIDKSYFQNTPITIKEIRDKAKKVPQFVPRQYFKNVFFKIYSITLYEK